MGTSRGVHRGQIQRQVKTQGESKNPEGPTHKSQDNRDTRSTADRAQKHEGRGFTYTGKGEEIRDDRTMGRLEK